MHFLRGGLHIIPIFAAVFVVLCVFSAISLKTLCRIEIFFKINWILILLIILLIVLSASFTPKIAALYCLTVVICFFAVIVLINTFGPHSMCSRGNENDSGPDGNTIQSNQTPLVKKGPKTILLLYITDRDNEKQLVAELREELKERLSYKVVDIYHEDYTQRLNTQGFEFIAEMLKRVDQTTKVVLIHTSRSVAINKARGMPFQHESPECHDSFYPRAIRTLEEMPKYFNNYRDVFNVDFSVNRLNYTSPINPLVSYKYPEYFDELCQMMQE